MAVITKETDINGESLVIATLTKREKAIQLDNLLSILNHKNFEIDKIKVVTKKDGEINETVEYSVPEVNEYFVLSFRDVDEILEFKVNGRLYGTKFKILFNFIQEYLQIKTKYVDNFKRKHLEKIIEKY